MGKFAEPAVAVAALGLYARTLGYGFVFDDLSLIGPQGPLALGGALLPYRPLRYLSYCFDHCIGGGAPWAYHATNVVLHAAAAVLVVRLARRISCGALWAFAAGALFALHPLATEAVAYVAGRRDLLSNLLGLTALSCWIHPSRGRASAAVVALMAAVAAKETGLLFVGVLGFASLAGLGPGPRSAARVLASALVAALILPLAYGARGPILVADGAAAGLAASAELASHYGAAMLFPLHLAVDYPYLHHAGSSGLSGATVFVGLAVIAAGVGAIAAFLATYAAGRRVSPRLFVLAWLALLGLAVVSVVGMHEPGADRHGYLLLAPLALALAGGGASLVPARATPLAIALVLSCLLAAGGLSNRRIPAWRDQWSLWSTTVAAVPDSARAQHNLAGLLFGQEAYAHAREHLRTALRADPSFAPAELGLAAIWCARGRPQRARRNFAAARRLGIAEAEAGLIESECASRESQP